MNEYIELITQWTQNNLDHAWWIIFLIAFGESVIIFGYLVPGLPLMLMLGGMIATGLLDPWMVLFWCVVGAVVGDGISFWIGQRYKYHVLEMWPMNRHPEWVTRGEIFFEKWGPVSILFGRFFGPLRATVPVLAGILGMDRTRFTFWNIVSAIIWAPAYLAPGFFLGWLSEQGEQGPWMALVVIILLGAMYLTWQRISQHLSAKDKDNESNA